MADKLPIILAAGQLTEISTDRLAAPSDGIFLADNSSIDFGNLDDLQIFHDGTNNHLRLNNGALRIGGSSDYVQISAAGAVTFAGAASLTFSGLTDVNISSPAVGDIIYRNGSNQWVKLAKPATLTSLLQCTSAGVLSWSSSFSMPTLASTLTTGNDTLGNDIRLTSGDRIEISDANNYIEAGSSTISLVTDGVIEIGGASSFVEFNSDGEMTIGNLFFDGSNTISTTTLGQNLILTTNAGNVRIGSATNYMNLNTGGTITFAGAGGTITGTVFTCTQLNVDNLRLDGNTISSQDTNGNIILQPNGTGAVRMGASGTDYWNVSSTGILSGEGSAYYAVYTNAPAFASIFAPLAGLFFSSGANRFNFRDVSGNELWQCFLGNACHHLYGVSWPSTTPTALTGNVNNWTGLGQNGAARIDSDGAYNITGMTAPSSNRGKFAVLINISSFALTLVHESGSSSANNQFSFAGAANKTLPAGGIIFLYYDDTSNKWRG